MSKFFMTFTALLLSFGMSQAFATPSTTTVEKSTRVLDHGQKVLIYKIAWTASSVDGSVINSTLPGVHGFLMKSITNPGAVAPTALYDIAINDADDSTLDASAGVLSNRSATVTEAVYPVGATGAAPLWFQPGNYVLTIANNSVNSATGVIWLYFLDDASRF
jgi:hypothetical protein